MEYVKLDDVESGSDKCDSVYCSTYHNVRVRESFVSYLSEVSPAIDAPYRSLLRSASSNTSLEIVVYFHRV
jgi:hypothetical protein